jgi:uncharacterized SAM-binding protein YcdF (DUF218 family)
VHDTAPQISGLLAVALYDARHIIGSMLPHISVGALLRSVRRVLITVLLACAMLAGIGGAVVAQAGRDEAAQAEIAVLMLDGREDSQAARLDRTVRMYLDGQISRIIVAGGEPAPAQAALVVRGVLQDKIVAVADVTQIGQIQAISRVLQEQRAVDALLINEPIESLRLLKIARDQGVMLHPVPVGVDNIITVRDIADEVGRYLIYCFVGR